MKLSSPVNRITINPQVMGGKPVIKGSRITVEHILELLSGGWSKPKILKEYPSLQQDDINAALGHALKLTRNEQVGVLPPHETSS